MYRLSLLAACAVTATACSNPKSEAPVDLEPGRYNIQASGGTRMGQSEQKSLCILPERSAVFTENPLRVTLLESTSGCTIDDRREGNAFSGSYKCSIAGGEIAFNIDYEGSLTKQSFQIEGRAELQGAQNGGRQSFTLTGKRSGDC